MYEMMNNSVYLFNAFSIEGDVRISLPDLHFIFVDALL